MLNFSLYWQYLLDLNFPQQTKKFKIVKWALAPGSGHLWWDPSKQLSNDPDWKHSRSRALILDFASLDHQSHYILHALKKCSFTITSNVQCWMFTLTFGMQWICRFGRFVGYRMTDSDFGLYLILQGTEAQGQRQIEADTRNNLSMKQRQFFTKLM